jgi:uncharacterized protein
MSERFDLDADTLKASRFNRRLPGQGLVLYHNTLYGSLMSAKLNDSARIDSILGEPRTSAAALQEVMPHLAKILIGHGLLIPEARDELQICQALYRHAHTHYPSLRLSLILGYDCNFACGYCFQRLTRAVQGTTAALSETRFETFVRFIEPQLEGKRSLDVSWIGGEPLLFLDRITRFGRRLNSIADRHGLKFDNLLITNGYGLTDEVVDQLATLPNLKLQVTIDGPPDIHDRRRPHAHDGNTFDVILGNVERCLRRKLQTHIRINVDEENAGALGELIERLDRTELGRHPGLVHFARTGLDVLPTEPPDVQGYRSFARTEDAFFRSEHNRSCVKLPDMKLTGGCPGLGNNEYILDPQGRVFKCPRFTHDVAYAVAEVPDDGDVTINANYTKWVEWDPFTQEKCKRCSLLPLCMGGCPFNAIYMDQESQCGETKHYSTSRMWLHFRALRPGAAAANETSTAGRH